MENFVLHLILNLIIYFFGTFVGYELGKEKYERPNDNKRQLDT